MHLDETPLPNIIFQKLAENDSVEDLTFRRSRVQSQNVLSVEACKYIGQLLEQQTKLWHFAFDCPVEAAGLPYISHGLSVNRSLQEVDLSFSSVYEAEQLAKGIAANKSITRMNVFGSLCSSEAVFKFFEELKANQSLVQIKLENMQTSGDILAGLKYLPASAKLTLSSLLLSNFTDAALDGLKHCKVSELELTNSLSAESMGPVMQGLAQNTSIKKLTISQKRGLINNAAAEHVADLIARNGTLTELSIGSRESFNVYNNHPTVDRGFQSICKALQRNASLTRLDLHHSSIRDDLKALGDALLLNRTLKVLNLSCNVFAASDLTNFCEALKVNATLESLNLSHCSLSRAAMFKLSDVLRVNKSLTEIDFSHHSKDFDYAQYPTLCDAIKVNSSLKKVVIGTYLTFVDVNQYKRTVLSSIAEIITCNSNITFLKVEEDMCRFSDPKSVSEFVQALKSNNTLMTLQLGAIMRNSPKDLDSIFATNYWLLESDFCSGPELTRYLKRNLEYRKSVIANTMVLCANIFRSQEAMNLLPPELWMNVFAQLQYPGIGSMAPLVEQFLKYHNSKQQR